MELKLDEATKKAMVGLMPMTQGATIEFSPKITETFPKEFRPVFVQRVLTRAEKTQVSAMEAKHRQDTAKCYSRNDEGKFVVAAPEAENSNTINELMRLRQVSGAEWARKTVVGWFHIFDASTGSVIAYKADSEGGADKDLFDAFCAEIKEELYQNALLISSLSAVERVGLKSSPESTQG